MTVELSPLMPKLELEANPKLHCLFLSGGMGTYAGIRGIKEGLEKQYGIGNVDIFNSVISTDPQNPKRFKHMADVIQKHAKGGLDVVAHSLGAVELKNALKEVSKKDKTFFENRENTQNLHIVLIGPSGFSKGIKGAFNFLGRIIRYSREYADLGKISKSNTLYRGVDALTAFPPIGISSQDLAEGLRKAIPELSHYKREISTFPLRTEQNYFDKLSSEQKEHVATYSEMIKSAIENRNYSGLRVLIKAYGEKLRKPLAKLYAGDLEEVPAPILEKTGLAIGGYIGLINTLISAFGSSAMKEIATLNKKGVRVDFVIPEYDIFVRLDEAITFFEGKEGTSKHIRMAEGVAHAFPALQKNRFGEMIKNLQKDEVS